MNRRLSKLYVWWYVCIGIAFLLLAARMWVVGFTGWPVAIRVFIGLGFFLLAAVGRRRS